MYKKLLTPLIIFFLTFTIFSLNLYDDFQRSIKNQNHRRLITTSDAFSNTFLPYTLIKHGTFTFNDVLKGLYLTQDTPKLPYYLVEEDGKLVSKYPIFTGILATPIYFFPLILNKIPGLDYHEHLIKVLLLGRISASVIASLSVVVFYLILDSIAKNFYQSANYQRWIYLLNFFYAFGTVTLSISSRTLWQHTSAQLLISLAILFLIWGLKDLKYIKWVGLFLGMAVLSRPTTILIAIIFSIYVFWFYRQEIVKYILMVSPSVLFLIIYNFYLFGNPFVEGYQAAGDTAFTFNTWEGITGLLLSPNRGLLFLSPPLLLGFIYGIKILFENKKNYLYLCLGFSMIGYFLLMASWYCWWGGDSFGYRMITEILPILGLFTFEVTKDLSLFKKSLVVFLILYSLYVHTNVVYFGISRCETQNPWDFECIYPTKELKQKINPYL